MDFFFALFSYVLIMSLIVSRQAEIKRERDDHLTAKIQVPSSLRLTKNS